MKYILLLFLIISNISQCNTKRNEATSYKQVSGNLYSDSIGSLYIKAVDHTIEDKPKDIYISKMFLNEDIPSEIKDIIDKESYHQIDNSGYSRDKNHVYFFKETLEGGSFFIIDDVDPTDFALVSINQVIFGKAGENYFLYGVPFDIKSLESIE